MKITHEDDIERLHELAAVGVDSVQSVQLRMTRRDGIMIWTEHRLVPMRDAEGEVTAISGIARDVTALKVKEAYLSHRALHDPLTGPQRRCSSTASRPRWRASGATRRSSPSSTLTFTASRR
jgi:hypothetical protein